jgi:hypothetical protein
MDQSAVGVIMGGWKSFLSLTVGSGVVATLGVYLVARFTGVFDAYAKERAKLLAQFRHLDQLTQQTQKLTETAEHIKARVSDEMWEKQTRWNLKRDMYIRLLEALGEKLDAEVRNARLEHIRRGDPGNELYPSERDKALLYTQEVHARVVRAACVAPLVVSPEAHQITLELGSEIQNVNYDHLDFEIDSDRNIRVLQEALNKLLGEAQRDLGLTRQGARNA